MFLDAPLRDGLCLINRLEKHSNPHVPLTWWKVEALCSRITRTTESLQVHSRPLRPLTPGDKVFIQNQQGNHPTKWDRSGTVVESSGNNQYNVKVDGSGRLILWNRRFLHAYSLLTSLEPVQQPFNGPDRSPTNVSHNPPPICLEPPVPKHDNPKDNPQNSTAPDPMLAAEPPAEQDHTEDTPQRDMQSPATPGPSSHAVPRPFSPLAQHRTRQPPRYFEPVRDMGISLSTPTHL